MRLACLILLAVLLTCSAPGVDLDAIRAHQLQILQAYAGVPAEVVITYDSRLEYLGETRYNQEESRFEICIRAGLEMNLEVNTLIHEWAHVMSWGWDGAEHHGAWWGMSYAHCFRLIVERAYIPPVPPQPEVR